MDIKTVFGLKKTMTSTYLGEVRVPVTKIYLPVLTVTQVKTLDRDGYQAVQVAFGNIKHINKPTKGHLKKAGVTDKSPRYFREIPLSTEEIKPGSTIKPVEELKIGDVVNVKGTTKGKGFAGVVKRWGFAGGFKTHGQSDRHRAPGSIGQGTTPGRVYKGKKMPGHMGAVTDTVQNLKVVKIDKENNEIWVTGAVPGVQNGLLTLTVTAHMDLGQIEEAMAPKQDAVVIEEPDSQEGDETEQSQPAAQKEEVAEEKKEE